jgi:hypothetical protein
LASLDFNDIGSGASADFTPPRLTLHYARDTGNSNLDASVNYLTTQSSVRMIWTRQWPCSSLSMSAR